MAATTRSNTARMMGHAWWSESLKSRLSSNRSLQLDSVKLELLVIGGQHTPVNTFPGLVHTARQAMKARGTQSRLISV
jgi:hypothetical protein